jgi:hypothetical protein
LVESEGAASQRFAAKCKAAPPEGLERIVLHGGMRHVIFDNAVFRASSAQI